MKKFILSLFLLGCISFSVSAQEVKQDVKKGAHAVKKGAKKVGNKTAEIASKGKAHITDQKYKDKVGPNGEVIYIDKHSKYYWIDKKGHKHHIEEGKLVAAPNQ